MPFLSFDGMLKVSDGNWIELLPGAGASFALACCAHHDVERLVEGAFPRYEFDVRTGLQLLR